MLEPSQSPVSTDSLIFPQNMSNNSSQLLECSDSQKKIIYEIIATLGSGKGYLDLLWNHRKNLETIGEQVKDLPTLTFLSVIFSAKPESTSILNQTYTKQQMKIWMRTILSNYFIKLGFINNFFKKPIYNLDTDLPIFVTKVYGNIDTSETVTKLKDFIEKKQWSNLLNHLATT